jgi:hypothetical protein
MRLAAVIGNQGIYEGKPQDSVRGYDGSYSGYLSGQGKKFYNRCRNRPHFPSGARRSLQNSTSCLLASGKIILIFANKFRPSGWARGQTLFGANDRKWREGRLR